jgi:hypothetical protein
MSRGRCPECGQDPILHVNVDRLWTAAVCTLRPGQVVDRIEQYDTDREANR